MNRDWLIRTKNNHILGPVSREKVLELLDKSYIKGDDEICSGNGYWFFVRESELVKKFLHNGENQPFNPVSEAAVSDTQSGPSILSNPGSVVQKQAVQEQSLNPGAISLPSSSDLEYPDDLTSVPDYDSESGEGDEEEESEDDDEDDQWDLDSSHDIENNTERELSSPVEENNVVQLRQEQDPFDVPAPKYKQREKKNKKVEISSEQTMSRQSVQFAIIFLILILAASFILFQNKLWPFGA